MLDTKGPEIRLRDFEGGKQYLESGNYLLSACGQLPHLRGSAQRKQPDNHTPFLRQIEYPLDPLR